jgi:hypothetical protein
MHQNTRTSQESRDANVLQWRTNIPAELQSLHQWIVWRLEFKGGAKPTKVPYIPETGTKAATTDPTTWGSFDHAVDGYLKGGYTGIGFVFSEFDPYTGIDLDNCIAGDGTLTPEASHRLAALNSYSEYSPSGTGIHVIIRGSVPGGKGRKSKEVEIYDRGRFFTMTGDRVPDTPTTVEDGQAGLNTLYAEVFGDPSARPEAAASPPQVSPALAAMTDDELWEAMFASKSGPAIRALYEGGAGLNPSAADMALCNHLAFWTGKDPVRMDQMFRRSGLYREKWDREDYRKWTIDKAIASTSGVYQPGASSGGRGPTIADQLYAVAGGLAKYFMSQHDEAFGEVDFGDHTEFLKLKTARFRGFLSEAYRLQFGRIPNKESVSLVVDTLTYEAAAVRRTVSIRVARAGDVVYLDLGGPTWAVIEIDGRGWQLLERSPVAFYRPRKFGALPIPVEGGELSKLNEYIPVTEEDWPLVAAWLLSTLYPGIAFPILALLGPAGSAKTTSARVLKKLVDPGTVLLTKPPRKADNMMVTASNTWILGYDNLSSISDEVSDILCLISTGGGQSARELYTDGEEYSMAVQCPIVYTAVNAVVQQTDLLDRLITVELSPISEEDRKSETALWAAFERDWPTLLGSVLTALSLAIRTMPATVLKQNLRMADFTLLAAAGSTTFGSTAEAFVESYRDNREGSAETLLEASPLAQPLLDFMAVQTEPFWEGRAGELLEAVRRWATPAAMYSKDWPVDAARMAKQLRSLSTMMLAAKQLKIEQLSRSNGKRPWRITRLKILPVNEPPLEDELGWQVPVTGQNGQKR